MLQSQIDVEKSYILNFKEIQEQENEHLAGFNLFFNSIVGLLFVLAFYQLVLSIQANLRDNRWQLGVLRSIGLNKDNLKSITLIEASANICSSAVIGFFTGYLLVYAI
jgi:ABC-type lipoprotein release transport system permease subunit